MKNADVELVIEAGKCLQLTLSDKDTFEELNAQFIEEINRLIQFEFPRLVNLLYQIDVDEEALKFLLKEKKGIDAAKIIAALIIERQLQKIKSRKQDSQNSSTSDDEVW